jgi:hypothetical protein
MTDKKKVFGIIDKHRAAGIMLITHGHDSLKDGDKLIRLSDHERISAADKARIEILELANAINMPGLLEDLDAALEDLELHGRHGDQGYKQLRAWYNEIRRVTRSIDAALAQQGKEGGK